MWNKSFLKNYTIVAVENSIIVGFGDISEVGYLDRLYVHKDYQHMRIATQICDLLENYKLWKKITVYASITAKPFLKREDIRLSKNKKQKEPE